MNGFDRLSNDELRDTILAVKAAFSRLEAKVIADPSLMEHAQISVTMQLPVIEQLETEIRRRGLDPMDPAFGRDVLGDVIRRMNE